MEITIKERKVPIQEAEVIDLLEALQALCDNELANAIVEELLIRQAADTSAWTIG